MIFPFIRRAHLSKRCLHQHRFTSKFTGEITVYQSLSCNPFANLAFEDWVYLNVDLSNKRILFLWRNSPTVVIGRHQNPWAECNVKKLSDHGVCLARRKSGGGTVYHDLGNVNVTFFALPKLYNRKENLNIIVRALKQRWKVNVEASPRDDILLDGQYKISGTSSKLGRLSTYHHCTLLCDVDTHLLTDLLNSTYELEVNAAVRTLIESFHLSGLTFDFFKSKSSVSSKATASVKSDVMNLSAIDSSIDFFSATQAISKEYYSVYSPGQRPEVLDIDPNSEQDFPGITAMIEENQEWNWIYGKTPRFSVNFSTTCSFGLLKLKLSSYHGIIEAAEVETDTAVSPVLTRLVQKLLGSRFWSADARDALSKFVNSNALSSQEEVCCREVIDWLSNVM